MLNTSCGWKQKNKKHRTKKSKLNMVSITFVELNFKKKKMERILQAFSTRPHTQCFRMHRVEWMKPGFSWWVLGFRTQPTGLSGLHLLTS